MKKVKKCRVCESKRLVKYLDFGSVPLANKLGSTKTYPIEVLYCKECSLSQLSVVIDPKVLYSDYPYQSSVSNTFKKHCYDLAISLKKFKLPLTMLDIASNDGCLMEQFSQAGYEVFGIEPSKNLADIANKKGLRTVNEFWNKELAKTIGNKFSFITATNVFAHVDDIKQFVKSCRLALAKNGILVIEVPYLSELLINNQFDTIYHEHLSYFILKPLIRLFNDAKLPIFKVEETPIHGGSIRIYASANYYPVETSISQMVDMEKELELYDVQSYLNHASDFDKVIADFYKVLEELRGKKVMGYGASAKGISLMNYCGITNKHIHSIVDDTPKKQGKKTPGSNIPIVNFSHFDKENPDYVVLLAWNFAEELKENIVWKSSIKPKFITPIPQVVIE